MGGSKGMSEWNRDIKDAPRDGTKIVIIYESNPSYQIVGWIEDAEVWQSHVNGWRFFDKQILGWMPLPKPPEKKHYSKNIECVIENIQKNYHKIMDDWCKAYLAKEYELGNGIHPGSFTIIQQPINDPKNFGYKYFIRPNTEEEIRIKENLIEEGITETPIPIEKKDEPTILNPQDMYNLFENDPESCAMFGVYSIEDLDRITKSIFKEEYWPDRLKEKHE